MQGFGGRRIYLLPAMLWLICRIPLDNAGDYIPMFPSRTFALVDSALLLTNPHTAFRTRRTGDSRTSLREHASCDRANHTRQYGASGTQREIAPLENRIPSTASRAKNAPCEGQRARVGEQSGGSEIRESSRSWLGETKIPAYGLAVSVESRSAVGNDRVSHVETPYTPQRHVVRIRESRHRRVLDLFSVTYKQIRIRTAWRWGAFLEPRARCCRVTRKCVQPF